MKRIMLIIVLFSVFISSELFAVSTMPDNAYSESQLRKLYQVQQNIKTISNLEHRDVITKSVMTEQLDFYLAQTQEIAGEKLNYEQVNRILLTYKRTSQTDTTSKFGAILHFEFLHCSCGDSDYC